MNKADFHPIISQYLWHPIVDMSGGDHFTDKSIRFPIENSLDMFKDGSIRTLIIYKWSSVKNAALVWNKLAVNGHLICWEIGPDMLQEIKRVNSYEEMETGDITVIKKINGKGIGIKKKPLDTKGKKHVCLFRHGALGDNIMMTAIVDYFKENNYFVTYHTGPRGRQVFQGDQRIDRLLLHEEDGFPVEMDKFVAYKNGLAKQYDEFYDMHGIVEVDLLPRESDPKFHLDWAQRQYQCDKNYIDYHFEKMGLPEIKGRRPSMWLSDKEKEWARVEYERIKRETGKSFIVLWNIMGSSYHKMYPWAFDVWTLCHLNNNDIGFVTVSDTFGAFLEDRRFPNIVAMAGKYKFRQAIALHSVVDAVFTMETNSLWSALCFDKPMVLLLSHSSPNQFTLRDSDIVLYPSAKKCECYPCHQIHETRQTCRSGIDEKSATLCMDQIAPGDVYQALLKFREGRHGGNAGQLKNTG